MKRKFAIWEDKRENGDEGITLVPLPISPNHARMLKNSKMVKEFEAESWEAARQIQYDYYGWGEYKPMKENE